MHRRTIAGASPGMGEGSAPKVGLLERMQEQLPTSPGMGEGSAMQEQLPTGIAAGPLKACGQSSSA